VIEVLTPEIFRGLWQDDKRFKVLYGGRGSGKSWQVARYLLIQAYKQNTRILCCREIQKSIQDSVHRLLSDQISMLGLTDYFTIKNREICGTNGSLFLFEGLHQNVTKIKSLEGLDYVWIEEGESITEKSWDVLIPTVRKPGSQIIVTFNPDRDDDPTYDMFITNKRADSWIKEINYHDNPHFAEPLLSEMEQCKAINYSKYLHIWEGQPITNYDTLVYRFEQSVNCIDTRVEYNEGFETWTGWDFGVADDTAIIFFQIIEHYKSEQFPLGIEIKVFDEYVNNNKPADHYREIVDSKGYLIDRHACDPSGVNRDSSLDSWVDKLRKNPRTGRIDYHFEYSHKYTVAEMIDNANDYMHAVRYNPQKCPKFHKMMRHWQYRTDKDGDIILPPKPEHDEYSHIGTALYYFLINRFPPRKSKVRIIKG
jgi:phage terminase large subunit